MNPNESRPEDGEEQITPEEVNDHLKPEDTPAIITYSDRNVSVFAIDHDVRNSGWLMTRHITMPDQMVPPRMVSVVTKLNTTHPDGFESKELTEQSMEYIKQDNVEVI